MLTTAENDRRISRTWQELDQLGLAEPLGYGHFVWNDKGGAIADRLPARRQGPMCVLLEAESLMRESIMRRGR